MIYEIKETYKRRREADHSSPTTIRLRRRTQEPEAEAAVGNETATSTSSPEETSNTVDVEDSDKIDVMSLALPCCAETSSSSGNSSIRPRVLKLYDVKRFTPICNHNQLEAKLNRLGFFAAGESEDGAGKRWKEYHYSAEAAILSSGKYQQGYYYYKVVDDRSPMIGAAGGRPRVRLPYPEVDMLHPHVYEAFLFVLGIYIDQDMIHEHFQIRSSEAPMTSLDRDRLEEDKMEVGFFCCGGLNYRDRFIAYRRGSLDEMTRMLATEITFHQERNDNNYNFFLKGRGRCT